jgi:hypothetical protein
MHFMRKLLPSIFILSFLFSSTLGYSQKDRFAYAVTDLNKEGAGWNALRKIDLKTGEFSSFLFDGTNIKTVLYDANTKAELSIPDTEKNANILRTPFGTGVAAASYDRRNNRLYFTPMFIDQLRYIDLKTMKIYYVSDQTFTGSGNLHNSGAKSITRMVINPDGVGYAISNDGQTFLKFTTGKTNTITSLGSLVDDPENKTVSIFNSCTSFGGDMISDEKGNLYIITARNHVFKVNPDTKVAKHVGSIKGLPSKFTVNGAVVDGEGNLIVSSAVDASGYYVVNPRTWESSLFAAAKDVYKSSDLANSNYLNFSRSSGSTSVIDLLTQQQLPYSKLVQVYPNPVVSNQFTMQFNQVPTGEYTMDLSDVMGRTIMQRKISIQNENQTQTVPLTLKAQGIYLIKLTDASQKLMYQQKLMIQ